MSDLRIPPSVTFTFECLVADICHRSKLDDYEWPLIARELLSHLQDRWREGAENGLSTDAAEQRALDLFGSAKSAARTIRQPWWRRMLFYQNRRLHRQLTFLVASLLGTLLLSMAHIFIGKETPLDAARLVGNFTNSFIALGSLLAVKWRPTGPPWLLGVLLLRHVLWFLILSGWLNVVVNPFLALGLFLRQDWGVLAVPVVLAAIPLGIFGAGCFGSEILDLAGRRRKLTPETLAFQMIR